MELDEPSHGSKDTLKSVWFKWLSPANATIKISTQGSEFDTAIAVYISAAWDGIDVTNVFGLLEVVSRGHQTTSDDIWWNLDTTSEVTFNAVAGQIYFIAVGGFQGANGTFQLFGSVQSWIPLPIVLPTVSTPVLLLDRLGEPRCAACAWHDRFTTITLVCDTPGAAIFYTLDGSAPDAAQDGPRTLNPAFLPRGTSLLYAGEPLPFRTGTVRAAAYRAGWLPSVIATSPPYVLQAMAPLISPPGQPLPFDTPALDVAISARPQLAAPPQRPAPAVAIRYTLDGGAPGPASRLYGGPVRLANASGVFLRAVAYEPGSLPSNVTTAGPYTVPPRVATPRIAVASAAACESAAAPLGAAANCSLLLAAAAAAAAAAAGPAAGPPPVPPPLVGGWYVGGLTLGLECDTAEARLEWAVDAPTGPARPDPPWTAYTPPGPGGGGVALGPGRHRVRARAAREGWLGSWEADWTVGVLQAIAPLAVGGGAAAGTVGPGEYAYFALTLPGGRPASTDLVLAAAAAGPLDIVAAVDRARPALRAGAGAGAGDGGAGAGGGAGAQTVWESVWAAGGAGALTVARPELPPIPPGGLRVFVSVRGAGRAATGFFLAAGVEDTPSVALGRPVRATAAPGAPALFKVPSRRERAHSPLCKSACPHLSRPAPEPART
jgi:hypothetical protein